VRSKIGIAAGILLNSRWIECYSRLGFDLLTYKTVRSAFRPCYPLPNWVYVSLPRRVATIEDGDPKLVTAPRRPARTRDVTSAVCFGMPCMAPEVWRADVRAARKQLRPGQLLIVSVVGTPARGGGAEALAEDFVRCARWARDAGAHIVEANFSCPNVSTPEGSVYQDCRFSRDLARGLRDALRSTPFFIKAGHFETRARLQAFQDAVAGLADGIVIVNGVSRRVVGQDGKPVFPGHERVGILGRAIHDAAVANVKSSADLSRQAPPEKRLLTLAVGGVIGEEDAAGFFEAGAAAVLLGGGAALDPRLAVRMKAAHPEW
jgi:dihydroorotate dehydrogenase